MRNQHLVLDRFKRVNDRTKPDLLGKDELTVLRDAVLDYKIGQPIKRGNFSRYDAAVSAGNDILTLIDVLVGSSFYLLATSDTVIARYDPVGNSWASLTGTYTSGFKFRMEHYKDKFIFIFDTDDDPRMIDSNALTAWDLDLGVADVSTVESFHDDGGNLEQNTLYKWVMVGITDDGQMGVPSRPFTHFDSVTRGTTTDNDTVSTRICFTALPYIADSRITGRMIFRNKATNDIAASGGSDKSGEVYYHIETLDNDSNGSDYQSEWEDNTADVDLGTDIVIYTNMPTRANYICQNRDRIFLGNFTQVNRNFISPPSSYVDSAPTIPSGSDLEGAYIEASELMPNQVDRDFSGASAWANVDINAYDETGDLTITANTADQYCTLVEASAPQTGGKKYILYFDVANIVSSWTIKNFDGTSTYGTVTANGLQQSLTFIATAVAGIRIVAVANDSSADFDNFSLKEVNAGYMIDISEDGGGGNGTLLDSTQYDYKINYADSRGRLSKFYHELTITTDAGGASNDHTVTIKGIGRLDHIAALAYPNRMVYRQTGGSGDFDLIESGDITDSGGTAFIDAGRSAKVANWADPDTNTIAHPARILASDIESPSAFREENYVDIYPEDGDAITGLFDDLDGVMAFKEKSVCKVFTGGHLTNWNRVKLLDNVGCSEPETLQKRGDTYYFIYNGRAYRYRYGSDEPDNIGLLFQDTLDTIVTWHDSTINDEWYMIQVKDSTSFWTLVFDIKLNAWYQFSRQQDGSEDFKVLHIVRYGSDKDLILSNADDYVSQYNQPTVAARADTENGSTKQISPTITTKTFEFPDGISKARLRELQFDYKKVSGQDTVITVTDEDGGATVAVTDNTGSGKKLYESGIGKATDSLKKARSLSIRVTGAGMEEWDNLRLEYRLIKLGL